MIAANIVENEHFPAFKIILLLFPVKIKLFCLGFLLMQLVGNFDFFMPYFCPGKFLGNGVFVRVYSFVYPILSLVSRGIHDF